MHEQIKNEPKKTIVHERNQRSTLTGAGSQLPRTFILEEYFRKSIRNGSKPFGLRRYQEFRLDKCLFEIRGINFFSNFQITIKIISLTMNIPTYTTITNS